MKQFFFLLFIFLPFCGSTFAHNYCADQRARNTKLHTAKTTLASSLLEQYDVHYIKLDLNLSPLNTQLSGNAITGATTLQSMSTYAFELNDSLVIDSAFFNGVAVTPSRISANLRGLTLPTALAAGNAFQVQIFYHGTSLNGTGFFTHGLNHYALMHGVNITFSLSDPNLARDWWPCKQSLTDKIDSADLWFTVPAGSMAGSNGRLLRTIPKGSDQQFQWRTVYPIEYYLISVAVAPYVLHQQTVRFAGSPDMMPVQHFMYDTAYYMPRMQAAIDSTPMMINYFSQLFGRYPFWKEKYGHCLAPLLGGMEHQTMTTLGVDLPATLIAHELGHQWWGDNVTYSSWQDVWLSEGWASYCEQLFVEHFQGAAAARNYRTRVFNRVMGAAGGSVIVDDTTDVNRIFSSRLTYDKGAAVAHMLRYVAPSDSVFFAALQTYQQHYRFGLANTDSLRTIMEAAYGYSLDTFFTQWVYKQGYPIIGGSWNQQGNDIYIQLRQTSSVPSSVAVFATPIDLQLNGAGGMDTVVRVYFNQATQDYHFTWWQPISGFGTDPENQIVNGDAAISKDPTLSVAVVTQPAFTVTPNPSSTGYWTLHGATDGNAVRLYDAAGRLVWQGEQKGRSLQLGDSALPAGIYTMQVMQEGHSLGTMKLMRR